MDMLYLGSVEVDRLENMNAASRGIGKILSLAESYSDGLPKQCEVQIKVIPHEGVTFMEKSRRSLWKKVIKPSNLLWCGMDPENREKVLLNCFKREFSPFDPETSTSLMIPLMEKMWKRSKVPADWKKGCLFKLPNEGDLNEFKNWRCIMILSIPIEIPSCTTLKRIKRAEMNEKLRQEQAGFRRNKSCIDRCATLRVITEQSLKWQSTVYVDFTDIKMALDSIGREVIWRLPR
ncbi:unnamed protein product [Trichobilharzia regenti]|nr:unnamed protein product [Trichobilharzia regenti]